MSKRTKRRRWPGEIRTLITKWRKEAGPGPYDHYDPAATYDQALSRCADELESLISGGEKAVSAPVGLGHVDVPEAHRVAAERLQKYFRAVPLNAVEKLPEPDYVDTPPHTPSLEPIAEQVVRQFMRADGSQAQLQAAILSALCAVQAEGYESGFSDGCGGAGAEAIDAAFAALKDATGGEYSHEDHIVIDGLLAARGAFAQIERLERLLRESDRG